ncbi:hypothetical protein [Vibrio quintilis]|uniref:Uncharacterized protein n=1 Tax=Vibrio quintilis TaxID=1117707 RepID=A0A1M7YY90_9VIBR|nr:hypothetical protein [Vibrio quintilis]SHO57647.1 hypothetical protein VQ7734_03417 [Vibrio quintilis]
MKLKYIILAFTIITTGNVFICQAQNYQPLDKLQGIYKYSFPNALINNTQYTSENHFMLMRTSPDTAYFETHLEWANGHQCDLSGIAKVKSPRVLTYTTSSIMEKICTFNINLEKDKFIFHDSNGACRLISCGSRGMLDDVEFKYNTQRKISPEIVKKSADFKRAISEYKRSN